MLSRHRLPRRTRRPAAPRSSSSSPSPSLDRRRDRRRRRLRRTTSPSRASSPRRPRTCSSSASRPRPGPRPPSSSPRGRRARARDVRSALDAIERPAPRRRRRGAATSPTTAGPATPPSATTRRPTSSTPRARERLETATDRAARGVDVAFAGEVIDGSAHRRLPDRRGARPRGRRRPAASSCCAASAPRGNALLAAFAGDRPRLRRCCCGPRRSPTVPGLAPTLAGMLGLGAGIDYALLLAARQQEELRAGHPPREAARRANADAPAMPR